MGKYGLTYFFKFMDQVIGHISEHFLKNLSVNLEVEFLQFMCILYFTAYSCTTVTVKVAVEMWHIPVLEQGMVTELL